MAEEQKFIQKENVVNEEIVGSDKERDVLKITMLTCIIILSIAYMVLLFTSNHRITREFELGRTNMTNLLENGIDKCRSNDAVLFIGRSMNGTLSMDCVTTFKYNESMPNKSLDNPGANI